MGLSERTAARVSALVYTGLALVLALAFGLAAPRAAPGDAVARYGGAFWVFLLSMIVLMPTFAPALRRWLTRKPAVAGMPAATASGEGVVDPVCGMTIAPADAAGSSIHGERTVYFCSLGCKEQFDREPGRFKL